MKWREWLEDWSMVSFKISVPYLETEWALKDADRDAAWELSIELLTRIATQLLPQEVGDEQTALTSVYALFAFTAKWHRLSTPLRTTGTRKAVVSIVGRQPVEGGDIHRNL